MSNLQRGSFGGSLPADVRLVLVGNIGCGKTSTGDNILGEQSPLVPGGTRSCQQRQGVCEGKNVTLVEAPRWFWVGGKMEESVKEETERAMTLVEPGLHAVLLLIPVNQFTEVGGTRHFPLHSNTTAIPKGAGILSLLLDDGDVTIYIQVNIIEMEGSLNCCP